MGSETSVHIIKLGGSLCGTPELTAWLTEISTATTPVIIVPGGGPFADNIRHAQAEHNFNDSVAHQMALLAMAQFGLLLQSFVPNLTVFSDPISLPDESAIWLPDLSLATRQDIAHSWDITADSLALWLAQQHGAVLALVKSNIGAVPCTLKRACQQGILDADFSRRHQEAPIVTTIFTDSQSNLIHDWYAGKAVGTRLQ